MSRPRLPSLLATAALVALGPLVAWNLAPGSFGPRAHDGLAALPLGLVALAQFLHQQGQRPGRLPLLQAAMLSTGFCLWAATQLWPGWPHALVLNDVAIVLFVVELFLAIVRDRQGVGAPPSGDGTTGAADDVFTGRD
jgi:hypothetical protein